MRLSNLLADLWYVLRGRHIARVGLETFAPRFATVLEVMLTTYRITKSAGIDLTQEWTTSLEQEIIDAYVEHLLEKWQPAHNYLNAAKPERQYRKLHRSAMLASRAYGETIMTYIEYRRLFLSPQYLTKTYYRKQRDGRKWDQITQEHVQTLISEICRIEIQEPQAFRLLVPSDAILEGVESIGHVSIWGVG